MHFLKTTLKVIFLTVLTLFAAVEMYDQYINHTTSDHAVNMRCSASLSTNLACWCYNEYGRKCPVEVAE